MKYYNYSSKYIKRVLLLLTVGAAMTSCEDFLDQEPLNAISPESYYKNESHVEACANVFYGILPSHSGPYGTFGYDTGTDNQFGTWGDGMYATGLWKVGLDNGSYNWDNVRNINFHAGISPTLVSILLPQYGQLSVTFLDKYSPQLSHLFISLVRHCGQ